jgi:3'-5' exoribonuclease
MKSPYVNEVEPDKVITTSFLVHSKEIRQKKTGEFYLSLLLGDRTGELDAKMWDNVQEVLDEFDRDDFVKVKGMVQVFHNRPQLTIHKVRRMDESEIDFADYFPSSKRNPDEMWAELRGIVSGVGNPHLKALLEALLDDPDVASRYRRAPAAKQIHHAFLGGLIEHVLSLCALARLTAGHYPIVDYDLLVTGVILHDIGKIYELNYERGFSYSNEGQLIGHISIAMRMVGERLRGLPDFPPRLRTLVEHMILSHHGQLEFGSPKLPQFPEALLLHYLDDVDSKMECMRALLENDRQVDGCFTSYNTAIARTVLKKERFLNGVPADVPSAAAKAGPPASLPHGENGVEKPGERGPGQLGPAQLGPAQRGPGERAPKADHPLFATPPDSAFANKLKQALQPAGPKQGG